MKKSIVLAAAVILLSCVSVYSEISVAEYEKERDNVVTKVYVKGLSRGFEWYNTFVEKTYRHKLYCPPPTSQN